MVAVLAHTQFHLAGTCILPSEVAIALSKAFTDSWIDLTEWLFIKEWLTGIRTARKTPSWNTAVWNDPSFYFLYFYNWVVDDSLVHSDSLLQPHLGIETFGETTWFVQGDAICSLSDTCPVLWGAPAWMILIITGT